MKAEMTKISCEECRARLGEVLAEDAGAPAGDSSETAALRAHIAGCLACARDFQILSSARAAMREFAVLPAPDDLRARVRAQLEREPLARTHRQNGQRSEVSAALIQASNAPSLSPLPPANLAAMPHVPNRRDVRDHWDRFLDFFRRPANVAWTSGLALAAFCLVLFAQPGRRDAAFDKPDAAPVTTLSPGIDEAESESKTSSDASTARVNSNGKATLAPKAKSGAAKNGAAKPALSAPALPGAPLPSLPSAHSPSNFPDGNGASFPMSPAALPESEKPARSGATLPQPPRTTVADTKFPQSNSAAHMPAPVTPLQKPSRQMYATAPADARATRVETQRNRREASFNGAKKGPDKSFASEDSAEVFSAPAAVSTPSIADSAAPAQSARAMKARPGAAASSAGQSRVLSRDNDDKDEERSTPLTRFIEARITPPRDVSWGQVSVVLSGGARFSDGGKSRVLWRGSATAGEAIEFGFSVAAPRGSYSAHLELQEVKHGNAQTVTSKSVTVNLK